MMVRLLNFLSMALMIMKRSRTKKMATTTKVESSRCSLPNELLTEVLAQVASASVADLCNAKLSCRELREAANDDYVYAHASMDKFPIAWPVSNKAAYLFLKQCKKSGNAEALYRQGMFEYFSIGCTKSGLELLRRAAEKKYAEAMYVYSIILLCSRGDEYLKQKGFELLSSLKIYRIRECRKRIKGVIWRMWIRNVVAQEEGAIAKTCSCVNRKKSGWMDGDDIVAGCESCLCLGELTFFCNLLRNACVF